MTDKLIEMYDGGSITGYQLMMDCLRMLDLDAPDLVLCKLPEEILGEISEYARRYDPRRRHSASFIPPTTDQVLAAERWIRARHVVSSEPIKQQQT